MGWAIAVMTTSLIACSSTDGSGISAFSDGGADAALAAVEGGGTDTTSPPVTQTVGASGGSVAAPGAVLTIPAGALPNDTTITVEANAAPVPAAMRAFRRSSPSDRAAPCSSSR
jgi:hypothetical protein